MQFHNLTRKTPLKKSVSVGRGGKRGKTSGRGTKGQNARSGRKKRPETRDIIRRIPKLRGRGVNSFKSFATKPVAVNVGLLETSFSAGDVVTPVALIEKGIARIFKGVIPAIKILGEGELTKKLTITDCLVSASAKVKIEKAGGTITETVVQAA